MINGYKTRIDKCEIDMGPLLNPMINGYKPMFNRCEIDMGLFMNVCSNKCKQHLEQYFV